MNFTLEDYVAAMSLRLKGCSQNYILEKVAQPFYIALDVRDPERLQQILNEEVKKALAFALEESCK